MNPMYHNIFMSLLLLVQLFFYSAQAEVPSEFYDLPKVVAVENRSRFVENEVTFFAGLLPSDAFNKGFPVGLSYTRFFKNYMGWEVLNLAYSVNQETKLKSELTNEFPLEIENVGFDGVLDPIQFLVTSNFVYTPIYSKNLLFNSKVVYGELSFVGGGGGVKFKQAGFKPMVSLGLYLRFYYSKKSSFKFDFRNNIYSEDTLGVVNAWSLIAGYSMHL